MTHHVYRCKNRKCFKFNQDQATLRCSDCGYATIYDRTEKVAPLDDLRRDVALAIEKAVVAGCDPEEITAAVRNLA